MTNQSTIPAGYRLVQNDEVLRGSDRYAYITARGIDWRPIRSELVGEQYDDEWPPHPRYVIRPEPYVELRLSDHLRRRADYLDGVQFVDPRTQEQRDAGALLAWRVGLLRRTLRP